MFNRSTILMGLLGLVAFPAMCLLLGGWEFLLFLPTGSVVEASLVLGIFAMTMAALIAKPWRGQ